MINSDIAVIEFCSGDPPRWRVWTLIGPDRRNEYEVPADDIAGITGIRVRSLRHQAEVKAMEVEDEGR